MKEAIGYVRVSSNGQVENGSGLVRQREAILAYAKANGFSLVEVIEDAGISGTIYDREGIQKVFQHPCQTVIIEGLDRLGRDLLVSERIIYTLKEHGKALVSVKDGPDLDSENPSRVLVRQLLGAIAQHDKSNLVARLRVSRERIRKQGRKCEGSKSLREVSPSVFEEMKRLRKARKGHKTRSYREIADILNGSGHTNRIGKPFTGSNVARILNG